MVLGDDIYSGAATFGKIRAVIGVIVGTLIGLLFLIGGIVMIKSKAKLTSNVMGTITNNPNCVSHTDDSKDSGMEYRCENMKIHYEINSKGYDITDTTDGFDHYVKNNPIKVWYDPSNPKNGKLVSDNYHTVGWIAVIAGVILLFGSWFWLWITMKYKFVAAAGGAAGVIDMVR